MCTVCVLCVHVSVVCIVLQCLMYWLDFLERDSVVVMSFYVVVRFLLLLFICCSMFLASAVSCFCCFLLLLFLASVVSCFCCFLFLLFLASSASIVECPGCKSMFLFSASVPEYQASFNSLLLFLGFVVVIVDVRIMSLVGGCVCTVDVLLCCHMVV